MSYRDDYGYDGRDQRRPDEEYARERREEEDRARFQGSQPYGEQRRQPPYQQQPLRSGYGAGGSYEEGGQPPSGYSGYSGHGSSYAGGPPASAPQQPGYGARPHQSYYDPEQSQQQSYGGQHSMPSRPEYSSSGDHSYRPQQRPSAQPEVAETAPSYFGSDPNSQPTGEGETGERGLGTALESFTSEISSALHNYARDLFPAKSSSKPLSASGSDGKFPMAETPNRFDSFAPPHRGNDIKWYVDGKDYMYAVSMALERARETIWILDWWLSPELYLRRPPSQNEQYRLDRMLQAAAARGVKVNIIVYKEITQALTLDSSHTKHALEDLHPNIAVFRHPDHLPDKKTVVHDIFGKIKGGTYKFGDGIKSLVGMGEDIELYFSHHEKLCLIDGHIVFMGGLDLCFGRWDMNQHSIADVHPSDVNNTVFPGQDYNDARYMDFQHVDKWDQNEVSRLVVPRMGWSDVALSFVGPSVHELQRHFIQRWNFIYKEKYAVRRQERYSLLDESMFPGGHGHHRRRMKEKLHELNRSEEEGYEGEQDYEREQEPQHGVRVQVCRSCSKWSHGIDETENSICQAYISVIAAAQHFVYIENQFFITATDEKQNPILNRIGRAIVDRIIRAARNNEKFRIVVCIPAIPGFAGDLKKEDSLGTRAIMEFQYRSINRDRGFSIMEQVEKAGINPMEYIRFYNLRNYDRINTGGVSDIEKKAKTDYASASAGYAQRYEGTYGGQTGRDEYNRYQNAAPHNGGEWDSVARCYMLGGGDIRNAPWEGDPDKEIDAFVNEELYIHSKILIADDRIAIIGSANLNDRSQLGDHDSEIAVVIEDPKCLPSRMNGRPYEAAHFAGTLRRQLFRKHLGLIPAQTLTRVDENMQPVPVPNIYDFDSPEDHLVMDPLGDDFWNFWNQTAKVNMDAFARVFHVVPHDSITTWKEYDEYWGKYFAVKELEKEPPNPWGHVVKDQFSPGAQGAREVKEVLSHVRGNLVEMPLHFLKNEDVAKEGLGLNAFTETVYT